MTKEEIEIRWEVEIGLDLNTGFWRADARWESVNIYVYGHTEEHAHDMLTSYLHLIMCRRGDA